MLIACVQTDIRFADVEHNLQHTVELLDRLGKEGVHLAVFPECMLTGYAFDSRSEAEQVALTIDSEPIQTLQQAASQNRLTLSIGTLLRENNQLFNAALLIDPAGVVGRYHKIHLPHLGVDRFVDRGGIAYRSFDVTNPVPGEPDRAHIGMAICYDSSFPEPMRALGLAGADIIALGTNWPVAAARTAEIVPPARSMENHLYFVAANRIGHERGFDFCGLSSICGPDGVELARAADDQPTELIAEVDLTIARNKCIARTPGKHVIDRFADRVPEFYGPLTDPK